MTTQMLYIATVGEKTVFIGKCEKTLEAWRMAAERLNAALGKTPAMKPIGNWNEWSQFEEDWTHVSYWREAEPKETLENYVREKLKEQEEKLKMSEVEVLKGML